MAPPKANDGIRAAPRGQKAFAYGLGASLMLALYGIWSDFVPSVAWYSLGLKLSLVATVGLTGSLYWLFGTGRFEMSAKAKASRGLRTLVYLALPGFVFVIFWLMLVHGLPDLVTIAIGSSHSESVEMRTFQTSSRRSCDNRLYGDAVSRAIPNYVCISHIDFEEFPRGVALVVLEGKRSALGLHISRVRPDLR